MKYVKLLFWETVQNLPMIAGFLAAARLRAESLLLALLCLFVGMLLGVSMMHFTEPLLHTGSYKSTIKGTLVNLVVFTLLAVPCLFYFSANVRWINWRSDILLGVVIALLMTLGQAAAWEGPRARMLSHLLAMAISLPMFILAVRLMLGIDNWWLMLLVCLLFTTAVSAVIVQIDYWPQFKGADSPHA